MSNSIEPIYQAGGALRADSLVYTKRGVEAVVIQQLRRMAYLKLIEPRQQGKTSLINWLSGNMHTTGYSFAIADVSTLDISGEQAWYGSLYERLASQVDFLSGRNDITLPKASGTWRHFLADLAVSANQVGRRVVIALDEIGTTHQVWAEPFFRVLRDVFNNRQNEPYFRQLTFILAGCYNPANLIQQQHESPFNIAVRIRLPDFTYEEVRLLASHLRLPKEQEDFLTKRIYYWTNGQPYLTQLLCYYLSAQTLPIYQIDVDNLVQSLLYDDQNHLPPILAALRKKPELLKYTKRILIGEKVRFAPGLGNHRQAQLDLIGVIKADTEGYCTIRNPIYVQAINENTDAEDADVTEQKVTESIQVFISYAHADERLCKAFIKHLTDLKRQRLITSWFDREISAGAEWVQEIDRRLNTAQIILLLVSPDFLSSDYCYDVEMKRAIERHERGEALVIPIILRPVLWKGSPFSKLEALPSDGKAVTAWANRDEAFLNIVQGIQAMLIRL